MTSQELETRFASLSLETSAFNDQTEVVFTDIGENDFRLYPDYPEESAILTAQEPVQASPQEPPG